jgi:hypothetical protein
MLKWKSKVDQKANLFGLERDEGVFSAIIGSLIVSRINRAHRVRKHRVGSSSCRTGLSPHEQVCVGGTMAAASL